MLEKRGIIGFIYRIMEWITFIAYINFLWVLFTLLGVIIVGLPPATLAMFTVTKKVIIERIPDVKIFPTYWQVFKDNFFSANAFIWPLYIIGYVLFIDFQYLSNLTGVMYYVMLFVFVNAAIILVIICVYIFPVQLKFNKGILETYKLSFVIGISYPFTTITLLVTVLVLGLMLERIPGTIPFFAASLVCITITFFTNIALTKIEEKVS